MTNKICDILGIEKPVISAAMTWITDAEFVAAVSEAGGAGILGFNAGYDTVTSDPIETAERLRKQIKKTKELTDKPFGVNFMIGPAWDDFSKETFKVIKEEGVDFLLTISMGENNINLEITEAIKNEGIKIVHRPLDPTIESMKEAEQFADILIATGFEEGGHTPEHNISLLSIFPSLREATSLPLMAAGGITNESSARAVEAMGADGVYVGTRFIVSKENPTAENVKQKIVDERAEDMIQIPSVPGWLRIMRNKVGREIEKMYEAGASREEISQYYSERGSYLEGMLLGIEDRGIINVSQAINNITDIKTSKEIVDELARPFEND